MDLYMYCYRQWLAAGFDTWDALAYGLSGVCPVVWDELGDFEW